MTATRELLYEQIIDLADKVTAARHCGQVEYADELQEQLNEVNQQYCRMIESLESPKKVLKG